MKSPSEIRNIIARGETQNVEFKSRLENDKIGEAICALANDWPLAGEGFLLIGIDDKTKKPVELKNNLDEMQQAVANICRTSLEPNLAPFIYAIDLDGPIIVVEVPPSKDAPCRYKNDCYIRIGPTTRTANFSEELSLHKRIKKNGQSRTILDKLPHREQPTQFIGRKKELTDLWKWFNDPRANRCVLAGDGGKGKTAIAYEFAQKTADAAPYPLDMVLWVSAKKNNS